VRKSLDLTFTKSSYYIYRLIEEICRYFAKIYPLVFFDKVYCSVKFRRILGEKLNLANPKTLNEKINWLKLYDRNPLYEQLADKYAVREYVKYRIGGQYLNDLIGVYDSVDEINFDRLPDKFVLKATHGCGWNIICSNKEELNIDDAKAKLRSWLKMNWYNSKGEWQYKNIPPRIVCEKYLGNNNLQVATDYKIHCFHGNPKYINVVVDRFKNHTEGYFDEKWNLQPFHENFPLISEELPKPAQWDLMFEIAKKISAGIDFCRVDLYDFNERVIFGEITLYHSSGFEIWIPREYDYKLGTYLNLPNKSI
jgi:hypothetical protein